MGSENKYEALARKLQTQESEGHKSEERAENVQVKFMDIEDELKVVGQNQQTLEVNEEQSVKREELLQKQIKELIGKLEMADTRSENAEMDIGRLNVSLIRWRKTWLWRSLRSNKCRTTSMLFSMSSCDWI